MTIFVTMRHDYLCDRKELRISVDLALLQFLKQIDDDVRLLNPTNELSVIELTRSSSNVLVLSGGPDVREYPLRDEFETALIAHAQLSKIKIIGICRGFQLLNSISGGTTVLSQTHTNTRHNISDLRDLDAPSRMINSFHKHVITAQTLSSDFSPLFISNDGTIESAIGVERNRLGVMWHPEREESFHECDNKLINDFIRGTLH